MRDDQSVADQMPQRQSRVECLTRSPRAEIAASESDSPADKRRAKGKVGVTQTIDPELAPPSTQLQPHVAGLEDEVVWRPV